MLIVRIFILIQKYITLKLNPQQGELGRSWKPLLQNENVEKKVNLIFFCIDCFELPKAISWHDHQAGLTSILHFLMYCTPQTLLLIDIYFSCHCPELYSPSISLIRNTHLDISCLISQKVSMLLSAPENNVIKW